MTVKNRYPLPLIQELIDKLKNAQVFSKMDIRWGYNNIRIKEGDEWKAAFRTNRGLFEPTVMFFGLTNSPATFQSFMNHILKRQIDEGHVIVYMDHQKNYLFPRLPRLAQGHTPNPRYPGLPEGFENDPEIIL